MNQTVLFKDNTNLIIHPEMIGEQNELKKNIRRSGNTIGTKYFVFFNKF